MKTAWTALVSAKCPVDIVAVHIVAGIVEVLLELLRESPGECGLKIKSPLFVDAVRRNSRTMLIAVCTPPVQCLPHNNVYGDHPSKLFAAFYCAFRLIRAIQVGGWVNDL